MLAKIIYAFMPFQPSCQREYAFRRTGIGDDGHSERMLAVRLKNLESHNLIVRRAFREVPPRVEYSLSQLGKSAMPHIEALFYWAKDHFDEIAGEN